MPKSPVFTLRLPNELRAAVEKAAAAESRTAGNYIKAVLIDHLRESGYLKPEKPQKGRKRGR